MRIRCLSTGRIRRKRGTSGIRRYFVDEWAEETLPVNVFLVEHEEGLCLFDTGQTARAAQPGYFPRLYPFFRLSRFELTAEDEIARQLSALGIDPAIVRWVVLSHLHTDHVGGLEPFRTADVVVSRREWNDAQGLKGRLRGYVPQHWPSDAQTTCIDFNGPALGPFAASEQLVPDGSLLLVPTPGHTRGHMSLLIRAGSTRCLLSGDLALTAADLPDAAPQIAEFCESTGTVFLAAHDDRAPELLARSENE